MLKRPILKLPDHSKPFTLQTDASNCGLGAALMQQHDERLYLLRCVKVFFVGFEFVYTVVSNLRSVIVICNLLNVIDLLSHDLLTLSSLRLPSFELADNQNLK